MEQDHEIEAFGKLVTEEMVIAGFDAFQRWAEDFEPPEKFVRDCLGRVLAAADPTTRLALARLLQSK